MSGGGPGNTLAITETLVSVKTVRAEVIEGPDAGKAYFAESEALTVGTAPGNDLVLTDPTVSRFHIELSPSSNGFLVVDRNSTNGTLVGTTRLERGTVPPGCTLRLGRTSVRVSDGKAATLPIHDRDTLHGILGRTTAMRRLMVQVAQVAKTDAAVLVQGESGTGKELVARALHDLSPRAGKPFVTVDCGALAPSLVASELFGHERGAFTGADRQHIGAFERADGGTVFLDEIGEMPLSLQSSLLGVAERKQFRRLGGRDDLSTNVRLVSATNRELRAEVNAGTFRLDLYYRLAVVRLRLPPLRERQEDVPQLVEHFLRECGHDGPLDGMFPPDTMEELKRHTWPGNVRELRNLVEATLAMGEKPGLDPLPMDTGVTDPMEPLLGLTYKEGRSRLLNQFESRYLGDLLKRAEGNVARAAREARIDRSHLIDLLRRHGLK